MPVAKSAFLSTGEISAMIGLSPTSIRRLAIDDPAALPPFMRVSRSLRFPRAAAEAWLRAKLHGAKENGGSSALEAA